MYTSSKQIRNIEGDSGKGDSDHDSCAAYDEVFPSSKYTKGLFEVFPNQNS